MLTRHQLYEVYYEGPDSTVQMIENLLQHLAEVQHHVGRSQQIHIDELREKVTQLTKRVKKLKEQLWKEGQLRLQLSRRVAELQAALTSREGHTAEVGQEVPAVRRDSHNSDLPPALDLPAAKAANTIKRTRSLRRRTGRRVGGQPGHLGTTLRRVEQPDQVVVHAPATCAGCAAPLEASMQVGCERRQVFEIPPVHVVVTEHVAETRRCTQCGTRSTGTFPAGVRAPVQYGASVQARAVYLHKYQLLPVARTSEALRDLFGCRLSAATVQRAQHGCAAKLVRTEERIKTALRHSRVIGADETGLRVAGGGAWVHVARTDHLTHYGFDTRRGKDAMDAIGILPQFRGTCVHDANPSYDQYRQCQHGLCHSHLLRELIYVTEVSAEQEPWTRPLRKLLREINAAGARSRAAGEAHLSSAQQEKFLSRYQRLVRRAQKLNPAPPPADKEAPLPQRKVVRLSRPSPIPPLVRRLDERREEILRGMTNLLVPCDNNGSERDLRMLKVQQKIGGCFRTAVGAEVFCRIRGYLSTARKQGHPLLMAIERVLAGKPLHLCPPET